MPSAVNASSVRPIEKWEADALLAALKPPKRRRPLIRDPRHQRRDRDHGIVSTDCLILYGILQRAGVAEVVLLAIEPGPGTLFPALAVHSLATVAEFDEQHTADFVATQLEYATR